MCGAAESKRQRRSRRAQPRSLGFYPPPSFASPLGSWPFEMTSKMHFVRSLMKTAALANVPKHIEHFSKFSPSPLSMKQFLDFGECGHLCLTGSPRILGHVLLLFFSVA